MFEILQVNDWAAAAEVAGNQILEVNPDMLILVEGILSGGNLIGIEYWKADFCQGVSQM